MSTFGQYRDTPRQIQFEGEQISVNLKRTGTNGVITWNIPKSNGGCDSDGVTENVLITINTSPTTVDNFPQDSVKYVPDPSANPDLHMGDRIGTALVIGVVGKDTTQLSVSDLNVEIPYYVSLHAISNIQTYHSAGVHSYSLPITGLKTPNTTAIHKIRVGELGVGVSIGDYTNLDPSKVYELPIVTDYDKRYDLVFDAVDIQTYGDLITEINNQAMLLTSPLQSSIIPNTGMYHYIPGEKVCSLWDGNQLISKVVLVQSTAPNVINSNQYWFNDNNGLLYVSNGLGGWVSVNTIVRNTDPVKIDCGYFWYKQDSNVLYNWNGSIWVEQDLRIQTTDPMDQFKLNCNTYWFNETKHELFKLDKCCSKWNNILAMYSTTNPHTPPLNHLWLNIDTNSLYKWDGISYVTQSLFVGSILNVVLAIGQYWFNPQTDILYEHIDSTTNIEVAYMLWESNPSMIVSQSLWWRSSDDELFQWDDSISNWVNVDNFFLDVIDPLTYSLDEGIIWTIDNKLYKKWDGSEWGLVDVTNSMIDPRTLPNGTIWLIDNEYRIYNNSIWTSLNIIHQGHDPYVPQIDDIIFNQTTNELFVYNGTMWIVTQFTSTNLIPKKNYTYFDSTLGTLRTWNGHGWINGEPLFTASLSNDGQYIDLETTLTGSYARIETQYTDESIGGIYNQHRGDIPDIFNDMVPPAFPLIPRKGGDGLQGNPSYMQLGVGTDGTVDERRDIIDGIRYQLGYPTVEVELTKQQFNLALDNAFDMLRSRSGMAYKRGYYFLQIIPNQQKYVMTDRKLGFNKIVNIIKLHRMSTSFLSNPQGQGLYGQMALQQLYNAGSFDLISYHLISQYVETMEQMFATKIMFDWNEDNRTMSIFKQFHKGEKVLMEVSVERTEQDMLKDRYLKLWIERYTLCQCRVILAEVRGKFGSLPGSGGGVTLNSNELMARADADMIELLDQLETYVVDNPEEYSAAFIMG